LSPLGRDPYHYGHRSRQQGFGDSPHGGDQPSGSIELQHQNDILLIGRDLFQNFLKMPLHGNPHGTPQRGYHHPGKSFTGKGSQKYAEKGQRENQKAK
jgi:hypothetical protein